jgi:hypothetical protein
VQKGASMVRLYGICEIFFGRRNNLSSFQIYIKQVKMTLGRFN